MIESPKKNYILRKKRINYSEEPFNNDINE